MKQLFSFLLILSCICCSTKRNLPDVSAIKVDLKTTRFEQSFFAIDTSKMDASIQHLFEQHKGFSQDFLFNILGTPNHPDSVMHDAKLFFATYKSIYTEAEKVFANFSATEASIKEGLQYVHYYFPSYLLPTKLYTFVGPLNSYASIITPSNELAVGLQLYLGKNYSVYQSEEVQVMYPAYISRRFDKAFIPTNCMKNIIDDLFLNLQKQKKGQQLVEQMIEEGKRLYLLDAFLPNEADSIKTGYTNNQLKACMANEKNIWSFFVQSDLLYQNDPSQISSFVNDGPNTPEFGEACPGNIGLFVGWQIVKKWMEKQPDATKDKTVLTKLIQSAPKTIFDEAKYKPH